MIAEKGGPGSSYLPRAAGKAAGQLHSLFPTIAGPLVSEDTACALG